MISPQALRRAAAQAAVVAALSRADARGSRAGPASGRRDGLARGVSRKHPDSGADRRRARPCRPATAHLSAAVTGRGAPAAVDRLLTGGVGQRPAADGADDGPRRTASATRSSRSIAVSSTASCRRGRASRAYSVTALFPPRVKRIDVSYDYPSFTGLAPREDKDGGDIYAPAGTRVRLRIHADKPVAGGELGLTGGQAVQLALAARRRSAELVLRARRCLSRAADGRDGLGSVGDVEYFIRVMDDRPPDRPHPPAGRRPGHHAARGSRDRGARRRRLRDRAARAGLRGRRPAATDGAVPAARGHGRSRGLARICWPPRTSGPAGRRDHLLRAGPGHGPRQAVDRDARATCSSSR